MSVVNVLQEFHFLVTIANAPRVVGCIEVEFHHAFIGGVSDSVAILVALHNVSAVLAVNSLCACLHRVFTRPEFNAVEHQQVSQARKLVYWKNPECHEHQFVDEFTTHLLIPS